MGFVIGLLAIVTNFIISVISSMGYLGIVLLMAIESACIPLPSEVIMPFAGYLASQGKFILFGVALAGAIGSVVGSIIAYYVGFYGGRPLVSKYGKYILITKHDLHSADKFFARHGDAAIFISRLLPVIRTFISLPAGIARMNFKKFVVYTFLGSLPWCYALAYVGVKFGENWDKLKVYFHGADLIIGITIIAAIAWFFWHKKEAVKEIFKNKGKLKKKR